MSDIDIIPLHSCIARPNEDGKEFLLIPHLLDVKQFMEDWVRAKPAMRNDHILIGLAGMEGACHDIVKADAEWQQYIRSLDTISQGPQHAPPGAFLFSYLSYHWLRVKRAWSSHRRYWAWMIRDLADHHGALKDLEQGNWIGSGHWDRMDIEAIEMFYHQLYPEIASVPIRKVELDNWADMVGDDYKLVQDEFFMQAKVLERRHPEAMDRLQEWRHLTTGLIAGDRFDIANIVTSWLDEPQWKQGMERIDAFCKANRYDPLSEVRMKAQQSIMRQLQQHPEERIFTLEMPTGYGKTLTSLKVATWFGMKQDLRKIVYVAPYLSILEQTSDVIRQKMGIPALEHHSLAMWDEKEANPRNLQENSQTTPGSQLITESWAHEIICTSFNQFAKAIFPKRAQDTLRRAFLQDSVIIIDEPQIFDTAVWNTFLVGLESLARTMNWRVLFLSATMPTFKYGLTRLPTALSVQAKQQKERYRVVQLEEPMDENALAVFLLSRKEKVQGAIVNTIKDAHLTYKAIMEQKPDDGVEVLIIHGLMIPLHKKIMIRKIQHHMEHHRDIPLIVISTQVLEAGVDVSFEHLVRAIPILPSIVQAAGRVNRHYELQGRLGQLALCRFLRNGEKDTSTSIYDPKLRALTDRILSAKPEWVESELDSLVKEYYREMFIQNRHTAGLESINQALCGQWPELSRLEPFGASLFRLPVFVPWLPVQDEQYMYPEVFLNLKQEFPFASPHELYEQYGEKKYWKGKDRAKHKRFMMLIQHYVLNVPIEVALNLVPKERYLENKSIPMTENDSMYDQISGMTGHFNAMDQFI